MRPFDLIATAGLALALAAGGTAFLERLAVRWGFVDRPAGHKHHRRPTPLLGGAAIVLGVAVAAGWRTPWSDRGAWGLAAAALMVFAAGLWDDRRGLSVTAKLAVQSASAVVLLATGWAADLPLGTGVAVALSWLWIVGMTNSLNLLDNMDGVAAGVTVVAAGTYGLLLAPDPAAGLAAALAGAAAGFLIFNFPRARIFMGDAGSLFLGLTLAGLAILVERRTDHPAGWLIAVLVLGVPIFDTTLVTVSRLRRGLNPLTSPGKDHLSHRLLRSGWSEPATVGVLCFAGLLLGGLAVLVRSGGAAAGWWVGLSVLGAGAVALYRLES